MLRVKLQKEFGNAGRGLVAPFKVGRTNEPSSFKSSSNAPWHSRRIVNEKDNLPIGISGLSIENLDSRSFLKITTFNQEGLDYRFSKLSLFHQKGNKSFNLNLCDSASFIEAKINAQNDTLNECSVAHVKPSNTIMFSMDEKDTNSGKSALIYGLLLENEKAGILFNMIGINGAEYRHYVKNTKFQTQVSALQPDLFIISLGTNEAYAPHYSSVDFYKQVDSLVSNLKAKNPQAVFILTTPGDSNKRVKYKNANNAKAGKTLMEYCHTHGMVYWNWYQIMGGYGVINKWSAKGLTSKDRLHLSRKGYEVQGTLLHAAIMNAYQNYKQALAH
jgi:lysophospholipase L1-like esterase